MRIVYLFLSILFIVSCVSTLSQENPWVENPYDFNRGHWKILYGDQESEYLVLTYGKQKIKIKMPTDMDNFIRHGILQKSAKVRVEAGNIILIHYDYSDTKYGLILKEDAPKVGLFIINKNGIRDSYYTVRNNQFIYCKNFECMRDLIWPY